MESKENIKIGGSPGGEIHNHDESVCTSVGEKAAIRKRCSKCKILKISDEFNKNQRYCKICGKEISKINHKKNKIIENENKRIDYLNNREEILQQRKEYRKKNKDKVDNYNKEYWKLNRPILLEYQRNYYQENKKDIQKKNNEKESQRRKEDISYRIRRNLKARVSMAIKENGNRKHLNTMELVGCSLEFLKNHMEKQFTHEMTWENYGTYWHIDHRIPCASFNLSTIEEQKRCFHWSNLQPLEAKENIRKGAKIGPEYKNQQAA